MQEQNDNRVSHPVILRTAHKDIPFFDERPNFAPQGDESVDGSITTTQIHWKPRRYGVSRIVAIFAEKNGLAIVKPKK